MQKNQLVRKIVTIVIFSFLIMAPLLCLVLGVNAPVQLTNSAPEPRPAFTFSGLKDGSFQKAFEAYWNSDFPNHHLLTKTYNELRYSLFGQGVSDHVLGKDGHVYNSNYIDEALCLNEERLRTRDDYNRYIDALLSVKQKAEQLGKKVSFILTPNKVTFTLDSLPYQYTFAKPAYETENAEVFREVLKERNVSYIDGREILENIPQDAFPLFGKGGIHWTLSATAEALIELEAEADSIPVEVGGHYETSKRRYAQDEDLWSVQNIWSKPEERFIYPVMVEKEPQGNRSYPKIMLQGGSYTFSVADLLMESALAQKIDFLFYEQSMYSWEYGTITPSIMNASATAVDSFEDEIVWEYFKACDWLILELNEQFIPAAVIDHPNIGSQLTFLLKADRVLEKALTMQASDAGKLETNMQSINEMKWVNFVPALDGHMLMGRNRGTITMAPLNEDTLLELSIPWGSYEQYCPDYAHQVIVFADGQETAKLTPKGNADQYYALQIPAGTSKIEIFSTGMLDVSGGIVNPQTIYYSLYARMKEAN